MYTGRKQEFTLESTKLTLHRPSYAQMADAAELVEDGKIIEPLLEAAGDKPALEKLLETADHEAVGKLFDDWQEFAKVNAFLVSTLERIKARNETIMTALEPKETTPTPSGSTPDTAAGNPQS